jgi:hypothetical protein
MARVSTVAAFPTLPPGLSNIHGVPAVVDFSAVAGVPAIVLLLKFLLLLVRMLLLPLCSCCSFGLSDWYRNYFYCSTIDYQT